TSNAGWITVTAGATGTGSGTVSLSVAANAIDAVRIGTVTIGGQTFTVTQAAAAQASTACGAFSLSPAYQSVGAAGGPVSVTMTGTTGCARTATSNASWITVTSGATGTGSGIVSLDVAAYTATAARFGTVTVGGLTFILNQAGAVLDSRP
ncbi:MAG: BACON domain-containing protein, partial [Vicinamibacteria bacterium]|nr:BACON domain-containing protein [Vicinamibacteria bacterium]